MPRRIHVHLRIALLFMLLLPVRGLAQTPEFRAFWADAFHAGFKTQAQADTLISRAIEGNYNALLIEVLAYHDNAGGGHGAYWASDIVPRASDMAAGFDALGYLCNQAHAAGMEVHAWIIPYRVSTTWPPSGNAILAAHPEWLMTTQANRGNGPSTVAGDYTLDAGSPDAQEYIIDIVRELVTRYPIDGINLDRIRYPQTDGGYPAVNSYANSGLERFKRISGCADHNASTACSTQWSDFRRRSIDELVRRCRAEIPAVRSNPRQPLRFTADLIPWGNAPSTCGGFASTSAYSLFQNWRLWMEQGWLDAAIPMDYKQEHCGTQNTQYRNWVDRTLNCWKFDRHVYVGQALYLNTFANSINQMQYALNAGAEGTVNYSYFGTRILNPPVCDGGFSSDATWFSHVRTNLFASPAPTPVMPWRDPATAVEGTLYGRVTRFSDGQPVDDALVQTAGMADVRTDGNGWYVVTRVPSVATGTAKSLQISKSGLPSAGNSVAIVRAGDVARYDFSLGAPAAIIAMEPATLALQMVVNSALPAETLTITSVNGAARAPLNYAVGISGSWVSASMLHGTTQSSDEVTLSFDSANLSIGTHQAVISIFDAAASNSPQVLMVSLKVTPPPVPPDFDEDGDVDLADFGMLQVCFSGPGTPQNDPACAHARLDGDSDVDQDDLALFMDCFEGADIPSDPDCWPGD